MTAAEQYAELKQKRFEDWLATTFTDGVLKGVELFEVKCPSGMAFKCRKMDKKYLENAGQMPMTLSATVVSSMGGAKPDKEQAKAMFTKMSPEERFASMQATAQLIRYCAVEPRLVLTVNGHKNAIATDDLTMEDFHHLSEWATGGDEAEGLKTFRRKHK